MASLRPYTAFTPVIPVSSSTSCKSISSISPSSSKSQLFNNTFEKRSKSSRCKSTVTATIILAPGQGAQFLDMGKTWRESSEAASSIFEQADSILGTSLSPTNDQSLSELISSETSSTDLLSRTDIAQPAIYVTSMACFHGMKEKSPEFATPDITAGLSLGEYTALTIAGAMKFEDGLRLVKLRGESMQKAAEQSDGSMIAVIGIDEPQALEIVDKCKDNDILVAANFNAPGQIVLSGESVAIDRVEQYAGGDLGLKVVKLDVAGAFHSPMMQPAANELKLALNDTEIIQPSIPVMSNVTGRLHDDDPDTIRDLLVKQLTSSVRWQDCCQFIKGSEWSSKQWIELAPGKTLSGIMRKIDRKTKVKNMSDAPVQAEV